MDKKKKKTKLERFVEAAEELNEVLGLEPQIETEDTDINTLASKMREASELIMEDDHFTKGTEKVLEYITVDEEPEEEDDTEEPEAEDTEEPEEEVEETEEAGSEESEDEDEPETEDKEPAEEAEGVSPSELREQVEACGKRKELLRIAMGEDFFAPLESKLPELKSEDALRGAMLKLLDEAGAEEPEEEVETEEAEEAPEAKEEKPKSKPKKAKKAKSTKKKAPKKDSGKKGKGVIATIAQTVEDAGKKGITKEEILEILSEEFPDRDPESMKNTISVQVPSRISKERFNVERGEDGRYRKEESK